MTSRTHSADDDGGYGTPLTPGNSGNSTMTSSMTPSQIEEALKPCPFCGSDDVSLSFCTNVGNVITGRFVECGDCSAAGPVHPPEAQAIAAWNRRPAPAPEGGEAFTSVAGLWRDQSKSRLERVRAHRWEFKSGIKEAMWAVDEEAARQKLAATETPGGGESLLHLIEQRADSGLISDYDETLYRRVIKALSTPAPVQPDAVSGEFVGKSLTKLTATPYSATELEDLAELLDRNIRTGHDIPTCFNGNTLSRLIAGYYRFLAAAPSPPVSEEVRDV